MFWFSSSQKEEVESPFWSTSSLLTGPLVEAYEQLDTWCLGSDHFERSVAQTLLVVFAINVVLILCVWRRCGDQIADQFLNLATSSSQLEEFQKEASSLELPEEHSPRI